MAKILIIDDRPVNRLFLTKLLGYQHHELSEASDGAEGLCIAREQRPDLIISDVLMPTMDGYEFVRLLRLDPDIGKTLVIFSTAHYLSREARALAEKCGITSIIYKPCDPQTVLDLVEAALAAGIEPELPAAVEPEEFDRAHQQLLTNKLAEQAEQLRDAHGKLAALIELSTEFAGERDPTTLLDRYCSVAREVIGARWTLVVLLNDDRKTIRHFRVIGLDLEDTPSLLTSLVETGIFKTVMSEGQTICLSDVTSTPAALRLPAPLPRAASMLVAPLAMRGRVDGWICLADKLGLEAFSEQDERLAVDLAAKMAVAYENARFYSENLKYARKIQSEISQRTEAERELSENRARLAGIFDSAMDAIITVDDDQRVLLFNAAAEKMFHCTASEAIGHSLDRFIPARFRPGHSKAISKFSETGTTTRAMAAMRAVIGVRSDGEEFPLEASISQIEVGGARLHTVIMRDITERQQAEGKLKTSHRQLEQALADLQNKSAELATMTQQLWQASKLATMGELAASIAHELNNPLATVRLRAELLTMEVPENGDRRSLEIITQEVDRMAGLVNNLLKSSRRTHPQISTVEVCEEIANSVEFIHYHLRTHNIEVTREFVEPLPSIQADRQQLRQLFLNLLTNASDAMAAGGKVTVRAMPTVLAESPAVAVEFEDTGEGISAQNLTKIWGPFFTTKPEGKGTGLGLPICRRIVEEHGGTIRVESLNGAGTTVRIIFPATESQST